MAGEPDEKSAVFAFESFAEAEAKARQVLKEKGFSDELIEAQFARVNRDYPDWPIPPEEIPAGTRPEQKPT